MIHNERLQDLLADLRARMRELRPDNIEDTMRLTGLLRSRVKEPAIQDELRGYLRTLGRQYREWRRAGRLG